jgi:hypothetical protein
MNASIEVAYWDAHPGLLGVEFDGQDVNAPGHGAYTRAQKIELKGDKKWKTAAFKLQGALFTNSQNGGADFRLVAETPELFVRKVTLQRD